MPIGGRKGYSDKKSKGSKTLTGNYDPTKPKAPPALVGLTPRKGARYRGTGDTLIAYDQAPVNALDPANLANAIGTLTRGGVTGGGAGAGAVAGTPQYINNVAQTGSAQGGDYQTYDQLNPGASSTGGFADRYTPAANMAGFYQHPDVLAADYLGAQGITNPEMIDQFTNLTDLAYALQLVMQGSPGGADQTNFIADLLQQYSTPGGSIPDFDTLVNMLLNPDSGNTMSAAYAAQADPQSMNNLLLSLLQATTGNPYYTNAMKGQLDQTQRGFYSDQFQGAQGSAAGTYADMLRKQGLFG